jgi:hypothetical protein
MGYFHRHRGTGPAHAEISAEEFRDWFHGPSARAQQPARELEPYEQALRDVERHPGRNLVVVMGDAGVVALVADTCHGAVWQAVAERSDGGAGEARWSGFELLEWDGERPRELRLLANRCQDGDWVELDPDHVLGEVRVARSTGKVQRLHV